MSADNGAWKAAKPFVNGGLSGMMATCVIQPIDMVKVRLQLGATGSPVRLSPDCLLSAQPCRWFGRSIGMCRLRRVVCYVLVLCKLLHLNRVGLTNFQQSWSRTTNLDVIAPMFAFSSRMHRLGQP